MYECFLRCRTLVCCIEIQIVGVPAAVAAVAAAAIAAAAAVPATAPAYSESRLSLAILEYAFCIVYGIYTFMFSPPSYACRSSTRCRGLVPRESLARRN